MKIILSTLNAKYIHSSLALRYLKAYSKEEFPDIDIVEYSIKEPILNMLSDLHSRKPDVIGLSCYIWNIEETINLVELIKKVMPDVLVVLGGPEVSFDITYWLERAKGIDIIVYGEGELSFHHLLETLRDKEHLALVDGIAYREDDSIKINPPREKLDLETLPSPYQDEKELAELIDKIVYYEASRGCPFSCAYCLSSIETKVRFFSIDRVKDDLMRLIQSGVKTVKFVDRTFNIHKKFALEIFDFLIRHHHGTVFQFEITADIMKPDVLEYLVENTPEGLFRFEIGVQSTNEFTNSLINRRQNFEKLSYTVLKLKESTKIDQHLDLIAGLPEEDYHSFKKTFNDVFELKPEELQLGFLKMLRGTQLWREANKYGYIYMDRAPYEILQNDVLSFADVVRIKRVEDVLEKYWNSHRMDKTVEYLINQEFDTPFDFFQEFGDFWEAQGWNRIGHQVESLFERLLVFLKERDTRDLEFIISLMKLDYFLNNKFKPRKTWWEFTLPKQEQHQLMKELVEHPEDVTSGFEALGLDEKNIHKHVMIDILPFNLQRYLDRKEIVEEKALLIVYFNAPNEPNYYFKSLN